MPTPITLPGLPAAPEEAILDAIEACLKDDPMIGTAGSYPVRLGLTGRTTDEEMDNNLDSTSVPYIKVRLGAVPLKKWTQSQHKATAVVFFDCYHKGLNDRDILRLTFAVIRAMFPEDLSRAATVKARFVAAQALPGEFKRGPFQQINLGESIWGRMATLELDINHYIVTS